MAASFPYTYYACPCSTNTRPLTSKRASQPEPEDQDTFNPHDPRAAYSLYPLDHLLFCDECSQIRCPKCVSDEIINWYCPNCLFDVPSSGVRSDGNRCSRNCYNCPSCTSPLHVTQVEKKTDGLLSPGENAGDEAFLLYCQYCDWSTLDIGVKFSRPTKITEQLAKFRKTRYMSSRDGGAQGKEQAQQQQNQSHEDGFEKLNEFYRTQLEEAGDSQNPYGNSQYNSPANLARIMSLYGGLSYNALKKSREKPQPMREASAADEGIATSTTQDQGAVSEILQKMQDLGWEGLVSESQKLSTPVSFDARFYDENWPAATQLRTKRGRRCRTCRQFIVRPESKITNPRYRIRIIAHNNIPRLSLRPFQAFGPTQHPSFILRSEQVYQEPKPQANVAQHYILTLRNPIFETVKVTLGTPSITPGRVASRVTILCPTFTIGPAGDVWDDALSTSAATSPMPSDGGRKAAMASLTGNTDTDRQPEAGKVWEKTRNSTSVVLEIVPGELRPSSPVASRDEGQQPEDLAEDDDVLEVPVYVRVEWMADLHGVKGGEKEARELGYWCVLGVGRISQ